MTLYSRRGALHLLGTTVAVGVLPSQGEAARLRRVFCWGDSLTAGGTTQNYPLELARLRATEVLNHGIGGQKSSQIAMRAGARPIGLTVQGNRVMPGVNRVTAVNDQLLVGHATAQDPDFRFLSTPSRSDPISVRGRLAGVFGTLTGRGVGVGKPPQQLDYAFIPDTLAASIACPPGSAFMIDTGMTRDDAVVIWVGRNNYADAATVGDDIAAMVAALPTRRFLVLSVLNGNYAGEGSGEPKWAQIIALNRALARAYRGRFVDVRAILVAQGASAMRFTNAEDYARDIPPRTLRADNIHLNPDGQRIVAATVAERLRLRGW